MTAPTGKAESILAAAQRTFLASGFGAVSMDAIAREAGASKATLYAYFSSKEELFGAVVARESERYLRRLFGARARSARCRGVADTIAERFLGLVLSPDAIASNRILSPRRYVFRCWARYSGALGPSESRQIEAFLRRAAEAGTLDVADARLAAGQFISLVRGEIHLQQPAGAWQVRRQGIVGGGEKRGRDVPAGFR